MSLLGMGSGDAPSLDLKAGFRSGWFRHIGVVIGGASGAAVVLGAYDLLQSQPAQAFGLLKSWGPGFLLSALAIFILGKFLDGLNQTVRESFTMVAASVHSNAEASGRTADALTRLAEQGGKQGEEVRRLALYAAQEFPVVYERFDRTDAALETQSRTMGDLAKAMMAIAVRGDK